MGKDAVDRPTLLYKGIEEKDQTLIQPGRVIMLHSKIG